MNIYTLRILTQSDISYLFTPPKDFLSNNEANWICTIILNHLTRDYRLEIKFNQWVRSVKQKDTQAILEANNKYWKEDMVSTKVVA